MYILRIFIICLIPFAAFADIPLEYKKIIQKYKAPPNTFTFVVKNITDKSEPIFTILPFLFLYICSPKYFIIK